MKSSQQAEREEQQRIKNLVLNYDLQQSDDQDSKSMTVLNLAMAEIDRHLGGEKQTTFFHNRVERSGKDRGQRVRKLQLSDVDW